MNFLKVLAMALSSIMNVCIYGLGIWEVLGLIPGGTEGRLSFLPPGCYSALMSLECVCVREQFCFPTGLPSVPEGKGT